MSCRNLMFLTAMCFTLGISRAATTNFFFAQGLELSRAGQFPEAASAFEKSAQAHLAAGTLVNLGIAEWQCGHAGAAIRAWEQSRWLDPDDERAAQNLKFAREVAQIDTPQLKWFETASTWLPPNDWVWIAGASLWLTAGVLVLPPVFRRKKSGWPQALAAIGLGIFLASLAANLGVVSRTNLGFVLNRNSELKLTPTREAEIISTLSAGEPARKLRTHGNYFFIRTENGSGWIDRSAFGLINE